MTRTLGLVRVVCLIGCLIVGALFGSQSLNASWPEGVQCHMPAAPAPAPGRDYVFVVDATGSMTHILPHVISEVKDVVNEIGQEHRLVVITFSGRGVDEMSVEPGPTCLPLCTPTYKAQLRDWLSLENHAFKTGGSGAKYAAAAIERALSYEPDRIYVLSDATFGRSGGPERFGTAQDSLIAAIHEQNRSQNPAKVHTIQFLNEDPLATAGRRGTLRRIAEETGGSYKFISERDLNLR